ncbi:hypothetical protein BDQ12DRAFT_599230, partial [Crucibulum laeve]
MPAAALPPSSTASTSIRRDRPDVEPDDKWKTALKKKIEEGLASMVQEAKDDLEQKMQQNPANGQHLHAEYLQTMDNIKKLATEQFLIEVDRERQERLWAAGIPMNPQWNEALVLEQ